MSKSITLPLTTVLDLVTGWKGYAVIDPPVAKLFIEADKEQDYLHVEPCGKDLFTLYTKREWLLTLEREQKKQSLSQAHRLRRQKHREAQEVVRKALAQFNITGDAANLLVESIASNRANDSMLVKFPQEQEYIDAFYDSKSVSEYPDWDLVKL